MRLHDVPVKKSSCILITLTRPLIAELVAGRPVSLPAHQAPLLPVPGPPVLLQRRVGVHHPAADHVHGLPPQPVPRPAQLQHGGGAGAGRDGAAAPLPDPTSVPGPGGRHHGPRHAVPHLLLPRGQRRPGGGTRPPG